MFKYFFISILILNSYISVRAQNPNNDATWQLIFSDDFNGTSINLNDWYVSNNEGEAQCYTNRSQNVRLQNGNLALRIINEDYVCDPTSNTLKHHTSGSVALKSNHYIKYGYIEARIKIPYIAYSYLWPAFWTAIGDGLPPPWYSVSEIDIFEQLQGNLWPPFEGIVQDNAMLGCGAVLSYTNPYLLSYDQIYLNTPYDDDFHLYAVDWSPERIIWYFDNKPTKVFINPIKVPRYTNEYQGGGIHDPVKVILNVAYQGDSTAIIDQSMLVDYVKLYQLQGDCNTIINNASYNFTGYDNKIKKSISLGGTGGVTTVPSSIPIKLRANDFILLNDNFSAPIGSDLYIDIPGCY